MFAVVGLAKNEPERVFAGIASKQLRMMSLRMFWPNGECEKLRVRFNRRKPSIAAKRRKFCESPRRNFPMQTMEPIEISANSKVTESLVPNPEAGKEMLGMTDPAKNEPEPRLA